MTLRLVLLVAALVVSACTLRPGPEVLIPDIAPLPEGARSLRVLTVTTRGAEADAPEAFDATRGSSPIWLDYDISVPPGHQAGKIEWPGHENDAAKNFTLRSRTHMSRTGFAREVSGGRVGIYIHGFNTRYQEALFRTAQLSADAHLEGMPILFTWPSEGHVAAYLADRDASDFSRAALADVLGMVTKGRRSSDPVPVLAHSMGARLVMEVLVQLRLAGRGDVLDRIDLVLAAPDIDIDLFRAQMATVGKLNHPITVLVSPNDPALKLSSRLAARRMRLGLANVHDPAIQRLALETGTRIVDVTGLATDDPVHSRYIGLISGEAGIGTENPFTGMSHVGAFIFNQVGGVFQGIGNALGG